MSLVTRISAFFLLSLALALGGFSTALSLLASAYMLRHLDEHIMAELDALTVAAEAGPAQVASWERRRPGIGLDPGVEEVFWVIYDEQGRPVDRSGNSGNEDFSGTRGLVSLASHAHASTTGQDGRRWRLAIRRLETHPEAANLSDAHVPTSPARPEAPPSWGHPSLFLMAGATLAPLEATLRNLTAALVILSLALWGLAAAVGRTLCRRALVPVSRMAEAAQAMTSAGQGQHLPSPQTGDELEHLAHSFNGLLDRLNEALERQKRFTGDASHQLRTPLTSLIGEIEVAQRRRRSIDEYQQILDEVHGDAVQLKRIVEAMLFLARAEVDAGRLDLQPLELTEWVTDHLRRWSHHARVSDLRGPDDPGVSLWVRAQPSLLGQLLDNLLENACKYSRLGTPITVRTWAEPGIAVLAVEDRGSGVPTEDVPNLFKPFYRAEQHRRLGLPGVGLGLAVVQRIAAAFGGTVSLESEPGRGSRFLLRLPEVKAPTAEHDSLVRSESQALKAI